MYAARGQYSSASSVTLKPLRQGFESTGAVVEAIRDSSQLLIRQAKTRRCAKFGAAARYLER